MQTYVKVIIRIREQETRDLLIGLLSQLSFEGFEEEIHGLNAFIPQEIFDQTAIHDLLNARGLTYEIEEVPGKNWNEEWEANFQPVLIEHFCCVRAHFHPPASGVLHDIIITPRMSFGTGHHATTYLMIQGMAGLAFDNIQVLDFGTGTGVLAILAEKLGAKNVVAIDNDEWSIVNARENFEVNGSEKIQLLKTDHLAMDHKFNLILANINRNVLLDQMSAISQHLLPMGVVLMSGLLTGDFETIKEAAGSNGLNNPALSEKEGWIALQFVSEQIS